ncbi:MAG: hypothetical protein EX271_05925 [Acidimicrobiales bacterium]|nr:hypothetical protein [Hyphomonadaceae bacterium]RZV42437.1 MAG: hypothetical protein EX271_05925 [Acidimicrobiales bacterium]
MSETDNWDKAQPLLPANSPQDRPMFIILMILAFLATLSLLSIKSSFSTAKSWQAELQNTLTVQVIPTVEIPDAAEQVKSILENKPDVISIAELDPEYSASLLAPWLGETPLPDDIQLPALLSVSTLPGQEFDIDVLETEFNQAGLNASVDNHQQWSTDFKKSVLAVQTLAILAFILIFTAIATAIVFATRAGLSGRRMLIDVLHQIGAAPDYTAKLFSRRFALSGFKAGLFGAIAALIILFFLGLITAGAVGSMKFIPDIKSGPANILLAALIPVVMAGIAGLSAWRTVLKTLFDEVYP